MAMRPAVTPHPDRRLRSIARTIGLCGLLVLSSGCASRDRDPAAAHTEAVVAEASGTTASESGSQAAQEATVRGEHVTATESSRPDPHRPSAGGSSPGASDSRGGAGAVQSQPRQPTVLHPFPHIEVRLDDRAVLFDGVACLDAGWLEFIVCTPGTKEHESLIVTRARPSHIHAALLLIGLKPGSPGRWVYENDRVSTVPPTGDEVIVEVIYTNEQGQMVTEPIRRWIRDHLGENEFPDRPWTFGGSRMRQAPPDFGVAEIYEADYSGSVIGLVTFGDEMLCFPEVLPDQVDIQPPEWEVNSKHVPRPGTAVTVVLRPAEQE